MAAKVRHSRPAANADPTKPHLASVKRNVDRMQPGNVETDATTGQRVIHPAANPQQVNPISDATHEKAAVEEAKILLDRKATPREKRAATEKSNAAQRAAADRAAKSPPSSRNRARARARTRAPRAPRSRAARKPVAPPATPPPGPAPATPAASE